MTRTELQLLTAPGVAGVAVLRAVGAAREALLSCLVDGSGRALAPRGGGGPRRAVLQLDGRAIDDVIVSCPPAGDPAALELHVHGSPAVLDQLDVRFGLLVAAPVNPAEQLLREALSVEQFDLAAEQLRWHGGDFGASLTAALRLPPPHRRLALRAARERSRVALALATPQPLVLIGRQNAGKSSLFNRLLFRERALTGAEPGLTRDPVAETTVLNGYPYELVDTAGEGVTASEIDRRAVAAGAVAVRAKVRCSCWWSTPANRRPATTWPWRRARRWSSATRRTSSGRRGQRMPRREICCCPRCTTTPPVCAIASACCWRRIAGCRRRVRWAASRR